MFLFSRSSCVKSLVYVYIQKISCTFSCSFSCFVNQDWIYLYRHQGKFLLFISEGGKVLCASIGQRQGTCHRSCQTKHKKAKRHTVWKCYTVHVLVVNLPFNDLQPHKLMQLVTGNCFPQQCCWTTTC